MKRIFLSLMLIAVHSLAFGMIMESGKADPSFKVVMRTAAGAAVTGLDYQDFHVYITEHIAAQVEYDDDEVTNDVVAIAAADTAYSADRTTIGVVEIGQGIYRVDLPKTTVDGGSGKYVSVVIVDDSSTALTNFLIIELTPAVDAVLSNGNTPIELTDIEGGDFSTATFPDVTLADDAITSSALAATAVTEIAAGIASDSTWLAALAAYLNRSCMGI